MARHTGDALRGHPRAGLHQPVWSHHALAVWEHALGLLLLHAWELLLAAWEAWVAAWEPLLRSRESTRIAGLRDAVASTIRMVVSRDASRRWFGKQVLHIWKAQLILSQGMRFMRAPWTSPMHVEPNI